MEHKKVKTLFKYIGGKSWLKDHLRKEILLLVETKHPIAYVEPFAGGLGAFLNIYDILLDGGVKTVILNDINAKLINFYKVVANSPEELINGYMKIESAYAKTIPLNATSFHPVKDKLKSKESLKEAEIFFKNIRHEFNEEKDNLRSAIQLLFLQNHCFNGVYRENSMGKYNTPFNWGTKVFQENAIREKVLDVNHVFKKLNVIFSIGSFENIEYKKNTLYYLDPPYINDDVIENKYNKDSFGADKQTLLIEKISLVPFIYSNHDNELLLNEFVKIKKPFKVMRIPRKNIISASNESRKTDKIEILVVSE